MSSLCLPMVPAEVGWLEDSTMAYGLVGSTTYSDLLGKVKVSILLSQYLPLAVSLSLLCKGPKALELTEPPRQGEGNTLDIKFLQCLLAGGGWW